MGLVNGATLSFRPLGGPRTVRARAHLLEAEANGNGVAVCYVP